MPDLWSELHDATLESIQLDWPTGRVVLRVRTGSPARPQVVITAAGTTELVCPRRHPWGASVSINEVRGPEPHDGGARLEIEMQSGDVLVLAAQMITCARVD